MESIIEFKKKILSYIDRVYDGKEILLNFLDETESAILEEVCRYEKVPFYKYGGIENSERNRYVLSNYDVDNENFKIVVYKINYNKRYYSIEHKHVLGTIMGLGIKREALGDIIIDDKNDIYFACTKEISKFIELNLEFINKAKIELEVIDYVVSNKINYEEKEILTSSYRLDGVISGVYNLSRSKSQELIKEGLVYINHINNMNVSFIVSEGDEINVRHYGKFKVDKLLNITRSGRYKIKALVRR